MALAAAAQSATAKVAAPPNVPGNLGNEGWFEWIRTHPNSPYAQWFDVDWTPGRVLMPVIKAVRDMGSVSQINAGRSGWARCAGRPRE